ncbi:pogo transposable element with KRAB domain [Rhizophagus clarus]|uniref:Pogo transposable element with KRAB domain n=1 Tax=Rhizophagus clarus TaxID=94130 RepID=A0A8H3QEL2_9GLOM|nr:pogo transposable element with KRAB domain [Rhizophagus clarus]
MTQKKVGVRQRTSYSLEEKLVVVNYAQENGRNAVAKHFNLDAPMVGRWIKQSSSWEEKNKKKKCAGTPGRKAFYPEVEKFLYNWIIEQRKKGFAVNYILMRLQMCKILKEPVIQALYPAGEYEFQGNLSWINSFMKRFGLSLRRKTKISQKLPEDIEQKLDEFRQFVIKLRTQYNFDLNNIFNMDETPVWFDMIGNMTVNNKDGTKYPPICIFKGKQLPRGEVIPKGVIC